jgi:hypothetical protein
MLASISDLVNYDYYLDGDCYRSIGEAILMLQIGHTRNYSPFVTSRYVLCGIILKRESYGLLVLISSAVLSCGCSAQAQSSSIPE